MRKMPFGYEMLGGKIATNNMEQPVVVRIYQLNLQGNGIQKIAEILSLGDVPYEKNKSQWNKNMVSRILQNTVYKGDEIYPQVVCSDLFEQVAEKRGSKVVTTVTKDVTKPFKHLLVCGECGEQVTRRMGEKKTVRWYCKGNHRHISSKITSEQLFTNLRKSLEEYEVPIQKKEMVESQEIVNLSREIDRLLEQEVDCEQEVREMIGRVCQKRVEKCTGGEGEFLRKKYFLDKVRSSEEIFTYDLEQVTECLKVRYNGEIEIAERDCL